MFTSRASNFLFFSVLLFVTICDARPDGNNDFRYDYSFIEPAEGWLKLHNIPATFQEAFIRCKQEGAILASPLDGNLQKALESMQYDLTIFTGIHATFSKGDFASIEGIPFSKISLTWDAGFIHFSDDQDCTILFWNGTIAGARCNDKYPYVCYRRKNTNLVINDCGTVDTGYHREPVTGSCYKFNRHALTWRKAQATCFAEGGHLAIINSDYEATVLKNLFAENPTNTIKMSSYPDSASLGYLDWDKKGSWYTVHGQSLEEAGYSKWASGSPNYRRDYDGGQFCGAMYRSGYFDDFWCESVAAPFICEKTYDSLFKSNNTLDENLLDMQ